MKITTLAKIQQRNAADLLVLPFFKGDSLAKEAASFKDLSPSYALPSASKDFSGNEGEVLIIYSNEKKESRIALLGLGKAEALSMENLRRAYAALVKNCSQKKIESLNVVVPIYKKLNNEELLRGLLEGILLANYFFTLKSDNDRKTLQEIHLITPITPAIVSRIAKKTLSIAEAVYMARDLVNGNADDVTPQYLAQKAKKLAQTFPHLIAKTLTKKELEKEKMGLLLSVGRGADKDPLLITLAYRGNPKSKDHTILVGKGVTYDTGGLNIKPTGSMESMKCDMAGAAAVLGILQVVAALNLKINVTGLIPATENAIGPSSFKPGDVYIGHNGKSIEIGNTDAEGRLILADALSYACKHLKPTCLIDLATLTGAMDIALGAEATGFFCNDEKLAESLSQAGQETFERVWRMPLFPEYRDQLKSDIADIKNIGGRSGGSITAALFLKEFVGDIPWAHLDIASTAYLSESKRYNPKFATGVGVRLITQFLESIS